VATNDQRDLIEEFREVFPRAYTVEDTMRLCLQLKEDSDRWAKWGEHVFTCPNKGINPCRDCVSPATADAMSRVDKGGAW
jgi:hypothetical protein